MLAMRAFPLSLFAIFNFYLCTKHPNNSLNLCVKLDKKIPANNQFNTTTLFIFFSFFLFDCFDTFDFEWNEQNKLAIAIEL